LRDDAALRAMIWRMHRWLPSLAAAIVAAAGPCRAQLGVARIPAAEINVAPLSPSFSAAALTPMSSPALETPLGLNFGAALSLDLSPEVLGPSLLAPQRATP